QPGAVGRLGRSAVLERQDADGQAPPWSPIEAPPAGGSGSRHPDPRPPAGARAHGIAHVLSRQPDRATAQGDVSASPELSGPPPYVEPIRQGRTTRACDEGVRRVRPAPTSHHGTWPV